MLPTNNYHNDLLSSEGVIKKLLDTTSSRDWVFFENTCTLKSNVNISIKIEPHENQDFKNDPLFKGKIDSELHDPNILMELMEVCYKNNPITEQKIMGIWLDGGRVMIPYPMNKETEPGKFQYFLDDQLAWHLTYLRTCNLYEHTECSENYAKGKMKYWANKLNIDFSKVINGKPINSV